MYSSESMKSKGKLNLEEVSQMMTFIRNESARLDKAVADMEQNKKGTLIINIWEYILI
jgi:hypothetical protein